MLNAAGTKLMTTPFGGKVLTVRKAWHSFFVLISSYNKGGGRDKNQQLFSMFFFFTAVMKMP